MFYRGRSRRRYFCRKHLKSSLPARTPPPTATALKGRNKSNGDVFLEDLCLTTGKSKALNDNLRVILTLSTSFPRMRRLENRENESEGYTN